MNTVPGNDATAARANRILLTGATGAIGAALLIELLTAGFEVHCLIRGKRGTSPEQRLAELTDHPAAIALSGDISAPLCGLEVTTLPAFSKVVHAAADTSLVQSGSAQIEATNLSGTQHLLDLVAALGHPELHYIGTTYIAGDADRLGEHAWDAPLDIGTARNPYERSKQAAERLVRSADGAINILRPAIVVGDSATGAAGRLEGIYAFFKSAHRLNRQVVGGGYADENGVPLLGWPETPLRVPLALGDLRGRALNLIQLDWIARTVAALVAQPARGRTYNLAHPAATDLRDVFEWALAALELRDTVELTDAASGVWATSSLRRSIRRIIDQELDKFQPYLAHSPHFATDNVYADLGAAWERPAPIDEAWMARSMQVAAVAWEAALLPAQGREVAGSKARASINMSAPA
ncbi:MAG: SDR family oxidoreductase [Pseudomonadota bacterium]